MREITVLLDQTRPGDPSSREQFCSRVYGRAGLLHSMNDGAQVIR